MPRHRPIRTRPAKDGGVIVELPPEPVEDQPIEYGAPAVSAPPVLENRTTALPPVDDTTEDVVDYDAVKELRASEKRARDRAKAAEKQLADTVTWAQEQAKTAAEAQATVQDANLDSLSNAVATAQVEAEAAEQQLADALTRQDYAAAAKAQRAIARAEQRLATLEAGKVELEKEVKQRPDKPVPPPPPPGTSNVEILLSQMPNLLDVERDWIREHPDSVTDQRNVARMQVAFQDAEARGIKRGSKEYFDFFNDRLGYDNSPRRDREDPEEEPEEEPVVVEQRRVAAPVRSSGSRGVTENPSQVILTAEQRQAARWSGVSEADYARGLQRLRSEKKQGYHN